MNEDNKLPKRRPTRLKYFDYNSVGMYFITICTEGRQQILSHIVGGDIRLCQGSFQHSKDFAIKNMVKIFGNGIFTITLFETEEIMRNT